MSLSDEKLDEIERNTNFHESPDWHRRFARRVLEAAAREAQGGGEVVAFRQFLTDVITAAGLVSGGKQDKGLGERIGEAAFKYLTSTRPQASATVPEGYALEQDEHGVDVIHKASQCREAIGNGFPIVYGLLRAMLAAQAQESAS